VVYRRGASGEDVTCTFTNTQRPQVKLVKALCQRRTLVPLISRSPARRSTTAARATATYGTTGFQDVSIGSVAISEAAHTARR
jgi:hypothetical protein